MPSKLTGMRRAAGRWWPAPRRGPSSTARSRDAHRGAAGRRRGDGEAVLALARDPQRRVGLGAAARARALAEWDRDAILGAVERQMRSLIGVIS